MKIPFTFIIILMIFPPSLYGQVKVDGSFLEILNDETDKLSAIPDGAYTEPTSLDLDAWQQVIEKIIARDYSGAHQDASALDYELVEVNDQSFSVERVYYLLRKTSGGTDYWGSYAIFPASTCQTSLVIQSPHPIADSNTGDQGAYLFYHLGAYSFFLSGTHRCNSSTSSSCSGTTSVCTGSSQAYPVSDAAHNTNSIFQKTTEVLFGHEDNPVFLQLHGFSKNDDDPYVIMSNGTKFTTETDRVFNLRNELSKIDPSLTFRIGHLDANWNRLLGTTNTQGRYINGSMDPCTESAIAATGRFIHMEQEFSKLRETSNEWDKVFRGARVTFGCETELVTAVNDDLRSINVFPNPFSSRVIVTDAPNNSTFILSSLSGSTLVKAELKKAFIDLTDLKASGVFVYTITRDNRVIKTGLLIKKE